MREPAAEPTDRGGEVSTPRAVAALLQPDVHAADVDGVSLQIARPRRVRSASDVIRMLIGGGFVALGLVLATVADETITGAQVDIIEEFAKIPNRLQEALIGVAQVIAASLVASIVIVLLLRREFRRLGVLVLGAAAATIAIHVVAEWLKLPDIPDLIDPDAYVDGWIYGSGFPSSGYLASAATMVTLASVWLSRRWKRALWATIGVLMVLRIISTTFGALDVVLSVAIGVVVGSLALVVFGAPNRAPDANGLVALLRTVVPDLRAVRSAGDGTDAYAYELDTDGGRALFAKLRTPDDRSADYLARWYRRLRVRGEELEPPYATAKRRIEHELLALHVANDAGAAAPKVVGMAASPDGSAVLVTTRIDGQPLTERDPATIDRELLHALWREVAALDAARLTHRNLALENVVVDAANRPHLVDWDDAELAADERARARDVAQVLVETSLLVGTDAAVEAAVDVLGAERVGAALPLLQPLALPGAIRKRLRRGDVSLDDLRECVRARTGAEDVPLERLERVKPRTLFTIVALGVAFYFLLPQLANIGDTVDAFRRADIGWIPLVLLGSVLTYVFAAMSFAGSVSDHVPFGAALRSRVASSFVSSFTPAGTGGMALGVRVLQRTGVDPAAAAASVGINQVAGVVVHVCLLVAFVTWTGRSGVGGFSLPDSTVLLLGLAVVLGLFGVALLFRKVRALVLEPALRAVRSAATEIAGVFRSPARVGMLFGGAAGTTLAYVLAFAAAVEAFDGGLSVPQIGAAYLGASIVGNAAPTPGGLGAVEAALVGALTGFGMASGPAVSAVLTFRLATYWLPVAPGWLTFSWMQAREEI